MNYFSTFILIILVLALWSCKEEDNLPPVIVLTNSDYRVPLGGTYEEQGARATDDIDGVLDSADISIDASGVRTDSVGEYEVYYSITDAAGNLGERTRIVPVYATISDYTGTFIVEETCDSIDVVYNVTIVEDPEDSLQVLLRNIRERGDMEEIALRVKGSLQNTLDLNDTLEVYTYTGSGELLLGTTSNFEFSLDYDSQDSLITESCEAVLVRQ